MSSFFTDKDDAYHHWMICIPLIVIGCFLIHYFMTYQQQPLPIKKIDDNESSDVDYAAGLYYIS
jgi:hypothetical protein